MPTVNEPFERVFLESDLQINFQQQKKMESFIEIPAGSDFPLNNLPYGAYTRPGSSSSSKPSLCVALGDQVVDLGQLQQAGCFTGPILSQTNVFSQVSSAWLLHVHNHTHQRHAHTASLCLYLVRSQPTQPTTPNQQQDTLNAFMALGKPAWQEARATLTRLLSKGEGRLRDDAALRQAAIIPQVCVVAQQCRSVAATHIGTWQRPLAGQICVHQQQSGSCVQQGQQHSHTRYLQHCCDTLAHTHHNVG